MSSKVQIQHANLRYLIRSAHDAGGAPGTPLTAVDEDGKLVEVTLSSSIGMTVEILDDGKVGYGLTPKDTGVCTKFAQDVRIDRAYKEVRYRTRGYVKVGDKWVSPETLFGAEAIRRGICGLTPNKGGDPNTSTFCTPLADMDVDALVATFQTSCIVNE